jgi:hypothetical protein
LERRKSLGKKFFDLRGIYGKEADNFSKLVGLRPFSVFLIAVVEKEGLLVRKKLD